VTWRTQRDTVFTRRQPCVSFLTGRQRDRSWWTWRSTRWTS